MNAHSPPTFGDHVVGVVDGRPELREHIAEQIRLTIAQAESAWRSLEIADDAGARYHVKRFAAHARQVIDSTNDLKRVNSPAYGASGEGKPQ